MMIPIPIFRINLKPLVPKDALKIDTAKTLRSTQREILKAIRAEVIQQPFSRRAKQALAQGVATKIGPNSVQIIAKHPAFLPLIQGKKRQQMKWLKKATRPIPIFLDNGKLIFRNATPRSMTLGRWYHPGHKPTDVIDNARKAAREVIKRRLGKAMQRQLKMAVKRS